MTGIIFALIAASGWGASAVFTKIALDKIDTRLGTIVSLFFSTVVMFSISIIFQTNEFENIELNPSIIQPIKEIKTLGNFRVILNLHSEIQSEINIKVVPQEEVN